MSRNNSLQGPIRVKPDLLEAYGTAKDSVQDYNKSRNILEKLKSKGSFIKIRKVGSLSRTSPVFDIVANSVDPDLPNKVKENTAVEVLSKLKAVHGDKVNQ